MESINTKNIYQHTIIFTIIILGIIAGILLGIIGLSLPLIIIFLSIPFLIISLTKPWVALCIFLLTIPLENIYVVMGSHSISKFLGLYLVFLIIINGSYKYIIELLRNKKTIWILVFGTVSILSLFVSKNIPNSFHFLKTLWLLIGLYFVFNLMIRDTKTLNYAIWAFLTGGVISVLSPIVFAYGNIVEDIRFGGLVGGLNEFAATLLVLLTLSISIFFSRKNGAVKLITITYSIILFIGFILTYSRGGFLAFCALIIFAMFKLIKGKNRSKFLTLGITCLIIVSVIFQLTISDKLVKRLETLRVLQNTESIDPRSSIGSRYYYNFDLGPKIIKNHPILGVGFREFISHNPRGRIAHNTFLEVLSGVGFIGFIPFIIILFLTWKELKQVQQYLRRNQVLTEINSYAIALELGFLSYLVAGLFISMDLDNTLWLCISLSTIMMNISKNVNDQMRIINTS
ncbi:O-antigen ligase family protein [Desulfobacterota bacterium AH_259_B03_O07]|nr:O-antigen ligase family protein [Desulfobacterota bacterium AH_259_B03_O07]